jgi:hypothetical protein
VSGDTAGRVLVIGGSGHGAWLMGALVRAGWDVSLSAVAMGDTDHAVARVLGVECVELAPFGEIGPEEEAQVEHLAAEADAVIVASTPFGRANLGNLRAAASGNTEVILVGTMDGRDYTGGAAAEVWQRALSLGARAVADEAAAIEALEDVSQ